MDERRVEEVDAVRGGDGEDQCRHADAPSLAGGRPAGAPGRAGRAGRTRGRRRARSARTGTLPVHASGSPAPERRKTSVTVNWWRRPRRSESSTARTSVTRGPSGVLRAVDDDVDRLADQAVERGRAAARVSASWQTKRSRVSAWRAEPAWIVVKPFTPDDSVSSSGSASRSRTSPTMATSGAMRRNPATSRRRSTSGRSGRGRACLHAARRSGSGTSASNTSSAMTTRSVRSSSAAQHDSSVVLPEPGAPANTIESCDRTHARRNVGDLVAEHVALDELVELAERHAGELADVDHHVAVAGDVAVDDVEAGAVVELRVLQALGRVELAVRGRRRRRGSW